MEFEEALKDYKRYISQTLSQRNNTIKSYLSDLNQYSDYMTDLNLTPDTIKRCNIQDYVNNKIDGLKPKTINRKIASIKSFHGFLSNTYGLPNPSIGVDAKKDGEHNTNALSEKQILTFLNYDFKDDKDFFHAAMFELMYSSGLRVSELCSLKLNDIDLINERVNIKNSKGGESRVIPITSTSVSRINDYLPIRNKWNKNRIDSLFINSCGHKITRQYVFDKFKERADFCGFKKYKFSPHSLRHSFATHMLKEGVGILTVKDLLGHSDISTTQIYLNVSTQHVRDIYDKAFPRK